MKILVNHSELTLKGRNRSFFENQLKKNIKHVLGEADIANLHGRFVITIAGSDLIKLSNIFGIANYSVITEITSSYDAFEESLLASVSQKSFTTFAVRTVRPDKTAPITSREMCIRIGDLIRLKLGKKVDLTTPDLTINIEIQPKALWYYFEKNQVPHGLPVASSGKVLCLLSGGIDSPVAAYLMAKRGCLVDFLHFHAFAENKYALSSKIAETIQQLTNYTLYSHTHYVPYTEFQMSTLNLKSDYELIIFRRFMLKVGEAIAQKEGYQALITGDNLGQVASQTLENLAVTDQAVTIPVLRPLIGFNKEEIIDIARRIGTYELSIKHYKDCCSIIEKHPKTKANSRKIVADERALPLEDLIQQTIKSSIKV